MKNEVKKCKLCGNEDESKLIVNKSTDGKYKDGYKCLECLMNEKNKDESIEKKCVCGHTRDEHCGAQHADKNPAYMYGHCSKCDCKKFKPKLREI